MFLDITVKIEHSDITLQSFQRKFDHADPDVYQKLDEYSKTLIQQIDTMSSIASAFS